MRALLAVGLLAASAYGAVTKVPEGVEVLRDLEYAQAKGVSLKLDLYLPSAKSSAPMPLVIWVHGGGWSKGSKANCPAAWLATKGYAVASLDFRLLPEHPWPAQNRRPNRSAPLVAQRVRKIRLRRRAFRRDGWLFRWARGRFMGYAHLASGR